MIAQMNLAENFQKEREESEKVISNLHYYQSKKTFVSTGEIKAKNQLIDNTYKNGNVKWTLNRYLKAW